MKQARNRGGLAVALCVAGGFWVAAAGLATEGEVRRVAADPCLNLRSAPNTAAPVERCVPRDARVTVIASAPGWEEVELADGTRGWMAARYLSAASPAAEGTAPTREPVSSPGAEPQPAPDSRPAAVPDLQPVPPLGAIEPAPERPAFVRLEPFAPPDETVEPVIRRGLFRRRELLSGELVPTRATPIVVPRTRAWGVQIRWLVEDGTAVEIGDRLIEFDNSSLTTRLEDLLLAAVESADDLARTRVEGDALTAEKSLALEVARIEREKAHLRATVPESILSGREFQERQLALRRAEVALEKALLDLEAQRTGLEAEVEIKTIALDQSTREIEQLQRDLEALVPSAPESGFALVERHRWEDRKFGIGDTVWPGMTILTLPDLASLEVEAQLIDVDDGKIEVGMPAICRLDAYPAEPYACRVGAINPVAQASSNQSLRRSFLVRLTLERTDPESMRPGMSVSVEIESERIEDVLLAPRSALLLIDDTPRAFLTGGGTAEIELGPCNAQECVVRDGLGEGRRLRAAGSEGP